MRPPISARSPGCALKNFDSFVLCAVAIGDRTEIYMKKQRKKIISILLLSAMLIASVCSLSGCDLVSAAPTVSIVGTEINADGELIIRYSNGLRDNLGVVVGKDGTAGAATVISAEINEKGELILHYSDATMQNLGLIGGNNVDVDIEITGEAEGVAAAVSAAAPSVVSLLCSFTNVSSSGISVSKSASAGVIYSLNKETGDALIVTNYHPIYEFGKLADRITVNVFGSPLASQAITATFVGGSMQEDIAVLRVQGSEFLKNSVAKAATLASVDSIYAGDTAIAIGNPSGKGISATYGKVNVVTERMETTASDGVTEVTRRVMRIDTAVNKGNSGGGLFDSEGRLIGIVSAKIIEENIENIETYPTEIKTVYEFTYMPEGYELKSKTVQSLVVMYVYEERITLKQKVIDKSEFKMDNESGYSKIMVIDEIDIYTREDRINTYIFKFNGYILQIQFKNKIDNEELDKMIKGIK